MTTVKNKDNKETRDYWKTEEEQIIKQWADKALCYQWMHSRCREIYQKKNAWYTIPVIIISTITGTANFAQDRFSDDIKQYVVMGIGTLSIIAGIVTTIYQFLQISELNEGYRAASISWTKLHNNLKNMILRHPLDRISPYHAIKMYNDEYEHLCEISPPIIKKVIEQFNYKFKNNAELTKPEICCRLESTNIYEMSATERDGMINKLNNKKRNPKLLETFFNLNGRNASDDEIETLQQNISLEIEDESTDDTTDTTSSLINNNGVITDI